MKPLKDWTLEKLQNYCLSHDCSKCAFYNNCGSPDAWVLDKPMGPDRDPEDFIEKY